MATVTLPASSRSSSQGGIGATITRTAVTSSSGNPTDRPAAIARPTGESVAAVRDGPGIAVAAGPGGPFSPRVSWGRWRATRPARDPRGSRRGVVRRGCRSCPPAPSRLANRFCKVCPQASSRPQALSPERQRAGRSPADIDSVGPAPPAVRDSRRCQTIAKPCGPHRTRPAEPALRRTSVAAVRERPARWRSGLIADCVRPHSTTSGFSILPIRGVCPPRSTLLPSNRVRWSTSGGLSQSSASIWPLRP